MNVQMKLRFVLSTFFGNLFIEWSKTDIIFHLTLT